MPLTDTQIKQAKPREKAYRLSDARGLYIEITPAGSKCWRLKYRFSGKEKRLSMGLYPKVTLKAARKHLELAKDQLEQGIDPSQAKKAKKTAQQQSIAQNFEVIAREWHTQQSEKWSEGYTLKVMRAIERDLLPHIGTLPLDQITPPDLLAVFRRIEARGAIETAHRTKQITGQIYRYAVATGRCTRDITPDLKGALAPHKTIHFPAITDVRKIGELLRMIDGYEGTATVRAALKLAPLVFVRPKELRHAEWNEVDFDQALWRIPAEKMKMGSEHIVPLSRQALDILQEQHLLTGHWGGYVFPSARGAKRPMSDNAILSAFRSMGISKDEMTGHGFRAMARTLLDEELQERVELIEHQLAHAVKDSLGRAYNRTTHLPQRIKMMQRWADYLDSLKEGEVADNCIKKGIQQHD